jgi:hypothetical protein
LIVLQFAQTTLKIIAMKRSVKLLCKRISGLTLMLFVVAMINVNRVHAQEKQSITGKLIDGKTNQAVPYATVALIKVSEVTISGGTMSDENGIFNISPVLFGSYMLKVSNIGYKPLIKSIEVKNSGVTDAGVMFLQDTAIILKELVIVGDRVKAKSESDRTTFLMTKKMVDASNTGIDVLRLVPGIHIDLMQNISLEGSQNILIYVDGRERDKNYLSQLNPKQIDKIEVISAPPSNYDGNVTGAINIVLKKDRDSGVNGQILAEIPTLSSEVYIFPAYSLNWSCKKLNLYTSYNGEMTYLNIHENINQKVWNGSQTKEITSNQYVRQKDWSNRFHYGFDYFLNDHDQFNFYAFYNPYSSELDGKIDSHISGTISNYWQARKEDTDKNTSTFYSLFYKHSFNRKRSEITTDISNYYIKAENSTDYIYGNSEDGMVTQTNTVKPRQNVMSIKTDYSTHLSEKLNFSAGLKAKFQVMQDRYNNFNYNENIFAVYGKISYKQAKYDMSIGLRVERSVPNLKDNFTNPCLAFLPHATFRYKLTSRQNIQLSYNKSITRPNIYQLSPFTAISNPYNVYKGNPFLKPELRGSIFLEHSIQFNGNYLATRLFCKRTTDVINNLTFINDTSSFETQVHNLGTISQYGVQFSGSVKISILTLNPYIKVFSLYTTGNQLGKVYSIENRNSLAIESGLSAIASFKHDLTFALTFQYSSPKNDIQGNSFSDMLYFLSLEKTIKQRIKIGIVSAIPFMKSFTYQASEIKGSNFYSHSEGNVQMSFIPFWFKLSYQFSSGKKRDKINRSNEEIDNLPKKGF